MAKADQFITNARKIAGRAIDLSNDAQACLAEYGQLYAESVPDTAFAGENGDVDAEKLAAFAQAVGHILTGLSAEDKAALYQFKP